MNGSILSKLLAGLGDNIASEAAKYGGKVAPNELRQLTVDGIADKVLAGGLDEAETILRNAPILTRAENIGRTLGRNTPEYQNVALTTLNDAPTGFGMVNEKYGGSWVKVNELCSGDVLKFNSEDVYQGFDNREDNNYCQGNLEVKSFNPPVKRYS